MRLFIFSICILFIMLSFGLSMFINKTMYLREDIHAKDLQIQMLEKQLKIEKEKVDILINNDIVCDIG